MQRILGVWRVRRDERELGGRFGHGVSKGGPVSIGLRRSMGSDACKVKRILSAQGAGLIAACHKWSRQLRLLLISYKDPVCMLGRTGSQAGA